MNDGLFEELSHIVGSDGVVCEPSELQKRTGNTLDSPRQLAAIVRPGDQDQAVALVKCLSDRKVPFYPVSTGCNWGYGGASPVVEGCVLLDLSRMNRILECDFELGYARVEPGVTQQMLYDYIQLHGEGRYMTPTTGAGPTASLLGNALERGYGITPYEDHFGALLGLKSVLADGSVYESALRDLGGGYSDRVFKWKVGPYLDGLFSQSNLGVVLEGTIALAPKPEDVTQFIVFVPGENLEHSVNVIHEIKANLKSIVGGVNLMNKRRLLSMMESQWSRTGAIEEIRVMKLAKKRGLPDWAIVGALYGSRRIVRAAAKDVRKTCRPISRRIIFLNRRKLELANRVLRFLPFHKLKQDLANAAPALEILEGKPNRVAMPLAYLKNSRPFDPEDYNPDRDRCGLIWFAPLVPMDPPVVRDFVDEVTKVCLYHDIDPLITLTGISERCFDATIPILFDRDLLGEATRARSCYRDLLSCCAEMGLSPYRFDIDHMGMFKNTEVTAFRVAQEIKKVLDPNGVIAPGRYG